MVLTAYLSLHYLCNGIHAIHNIAKAHCVERLSKSENKRLAEWAIGRIESFAGYEGTVISIEARPYFSYLSQLHKDYERDLKTNYFEEQQLDDYQAAELIYKDQLEDELKKLEDKDVTINISL